MLLGLPVRERQKVAQRDGAGLAEAWEAILSKPFRFNPCEEYQSYGLALRNETPATIRAKCASILSGRKESAGPERGCARKGGG